LEQKWVQVCFNYIIGPWAKQCTEAHSHITTYRKKTVNVNKIKNIFIVLVLPTIPVSGYVAMGLSALLCPGAYNVVKTDLYSLYWKGKFLQIPVLILLERKAPPCPHLGCCMLQKTRLCRMLCAPIKWVYVGCCVLQKTRLCRMLCTPKNKVMQDVVCSIKWIYVGISLLNDLMLKHWFCWKYQYNKYIFNLINIYSFIHEWVGHLRWQHHCFGNDGYTISICFYSIPWTKHRRCW
jgi:hypothetical protein